MKSTIMKIVKLFPAIRNMFECLFKRRYRYLYKIIEDKKCKRIMEIGTFDGYHALRMILAAKKNYGSMVEYYGFDLFETMNKEILESEFSKQPISEEKTKILLNKANCKVHLFKGFTKDTLKCEIDNLPKMDLIFIDGGHALKTIDNDWLYCQKLMHDHTVVLFDDYWNRNDMGCKLIVDSIDTEGFTVEVLPITDTFISRKGSLRIKIAKVTFKQAGPE